MTKINIIINQNTEWDFLIKHYWTNHINSGRKRFEINRFFYERKIDMTSRNFKLNYPSKEMEAFMLGKS
jgi:hypothetical protein